MLLVNTKTEWSGSRPGGDHVKSPAPPPESVDSTRLRSAVPLASRAQAGPRHGRAAMRAARRRSGPAARRSWLAARHSAGFVAPPVGAPAAPRHEVVGGGVPGSGLPVLEGQGDEVPANTRSRPGLRAPEDQAVDTGCPPPTADDIGPAVAELAGGSVHLEDRGARARPLLPDALAGRNRQRGRAPRSHDRSPESAPECVSPDGEGRLQPRAPPGHRRKTKEFWIGGSAMAGPRGAARPRTRHAWMARVRSTRCRWRRPSRCAARRDRRLRLPCPRSARRSRYAGGRGPRRGSGRRGSRRGPCAGRCRAS